MTLTSTTWASKLPWFLRLIRFIGLLDGLCPGFVAGERPHRKGALGRGPSYRARRAGDGGDARRLFLGHIFQGQRTEEW